MGFSIFTAGTKAKSAEVNANYNKLIALQGCTVIRQLIDRAGVWSAGNIEGWGEAYIDADGRENSVSANTGFFTNGKIIPSYPDVADNASPSTTFHDFSTDVISQYDLSNGNTGASTVIKNDFAISGGSMTGSVSISGGSTTGGDGFVSAEYDNNLISNQMGMTVEITFSASLFNGNNSFYQEGTATIYLNGVSAWSQSIINTSGTFNYSNYKLKLEPISETSYKKWLDIGAGYVDQGNITISGSYFDLKFYAYVRNDDDRQASASLSIHDIKYNYPQQNSEITHTIPANTFPATISKAIGVPMIVDWETGADIQYKLTNGSEDTGWLSCSNNPTLTGFSAFTSQPTSLIVKLTPKSSSPTAGYPSIKGFYIYSE